MRQSKYFKLILSIVVFKFTWKVFTQRAVYIYSKAGHSIIISSLPNCFRIYDLNTDYKRNGPQVKQLGSLVVNFFYWIAKYPKINSTDPIKMQLALVLWMM